MPQQLATGADAARRKSEVSSDCLGLRRDDEAGLATEPADQREGEGCVRAEIEERVDEVARAEGCGEGDESARERARMPLLECGGELVDEVGVANAGLFRRVVWERANVGVESVNWSRG